MKDEIDIPDEVIDDDILSDDDFDKNLLDDNLDLGFNDYLDAGSQAPMDKHKDLLIDLTNFEPEIKDKVNYWLGRTWDTKKEEYIQNENLTPLMTEELAIWCISFLRNYSKKTNIITHLLLKDYNYIHEDIITILWEEFGTKEEVDGMSNNDLKRICVELEHAALLVLMGAGDGKYNKLLKESTQRNENVTLVDNLNQGMGQGQGQRPMKKQGFLDKARTRLLGGQ